MTRLKAVQGLTGAKDRTQIEEITGVSFKDLVEAPLEGKGLDWDLGWFMGATCTLAFNLKTNFPKSKGNRVKWLGAVRGYMVEHAR